ncbi:MAG TPA: PKD domain-containing protein [Planctomycetota bacterium]|jgi:hypothetical protein
MKRLLNAGVCLLCAALLQSAIRAEEPDDGRKPLYIRADPKGAAKLSFQWRQVEGPAAKIADPNAARLDNGKWVSETYFVPREAGKYIFEVVVRNEDGQETVGKVVWDVVPPTPAPTAIAGKDQNKQVGEVVRINGVGSKAAEGQKIAEYSWQLIESPSKFKGIEPKLLKERAFDFKAEQPGTYRFELKVYDGKRWSEPSPISVVVTANTPKPVVDQETTGTRHTELTPPVTVAQTKKIEIKPVVPAGGSLKVGDVVVLDGSKSEVEASLKPEFRWRALKGMVRELKAEVSRPFSKDRDDVMNYPVWTCRPNQPGEYSFVLEISVDDPVSKKQVVKESDPVVFTVEAPEPPPVVKTEPVKPPKEVVEAPKPPAESPDKPKTDPPPKETPRKPAVAPTVTENAGTAADVVPLDTVPEKPPVADVPKPPKSDPKPEIKPDTPPKTDNTTAAPVAEITAEKTTVEIGEMVTLDGSKSKDPAGEKLEYVWGPVPGKRYPKTFVGTEGPKVQFRAEEEGEYTVALIVKAGQALSAPVNIVINATSANQPPVIKVAKSFECVVGEQLRLEAEVSDPEGDQITTKWTVIDPPDLAIPDKFSRHYDPATKMSVLVFVPKNLGTYLFQLTATDAGGKSSTAKTQVGVKEAINRPPTAIIDGPKTAMTGTKIKLSGARSVDPEKKPLTYLWSQEIQGTEPKIPGDPPHEKDKVWEFTPAQPGRYVVSLIVSDGVNKSDPEKFELSVTAANNPPIANIAAPPGGKVTVGASVTLDGSASSDPENEKLTYKWRKLDGKAEVELVDADKEKCTVKANSLGTLRMELVVNDGTSSSEPAAVDLLVVRANQQPVAKITGPETAKQGTLVELSAIESSDPDGDEITYVWSQPSDGGPEIGVHGKDLRKKTLRFKADKPGTYVVNLEVVDSEGAKSEPVTHKIVVKGINKPPRAVAARVGEGAIMAGAEVKLSARGSIDPEGAALTYKWKQLSGDAVQLPQESSEIVNIVPKMPGGYEFELIVNDGESDSLPAKVSFMVKAPNKPPVAVINDVVGCEPGGRVVLDGSASTDPDGDKLEYKWSQVSGPEAKFPWRGTGKAKTEAVLTKEGEYVFELKVFDGKEWSEPKQVAVKTRAPNQPPVAAFTGTEAGATAELRTEEGSETVLDASASSDPDNGPRPLSFIFRQTAGPRVELRTEGALAKFTPKRAGRMTFEVIASDGKNESLPAVATVEVLKAGTLPVAVAEAPAVLKAAQKGVKDDPNILILDGRKSASKAGPLTYTWKQVGGDPLGLRAAELAKVRVGMRIFVPGNYRFMLTVSDGQNTSIPKYVDIKVVDASGNAAPEKTEAPKDAPKAPAPEKSPAPAPAPKDQSSNDPLPPPNAKKGNDGMSSDREGLLLPPPKEASTRSTEAQTPAQKALSDLAQKADPEAEKKLIESLSSKEAETRSTAAAALVRRGINSIPALIGVLDGSAGLRAGDEPAAKKEAAWALRELTHETFGQDPEKWKKWWAQQPASKNAPLSEK